MLYELEQPDQMRAVGAKEAGRDELVRAIFPFRKPPESVLDSTYLIVDPELQLETAFHQTSSSVMLFPRADGKILIPSIAIGDDHPSVNLGYFMRETMHVTTTYARRWGVWMGRNILRFNPHKTDDYTPTRADNFLSMMREMQALYNEGFSSGAVNREGLRERLQRVVQGYWLEYYSDTLPSRIEQEPNGDVRDEVDKLFEGYEDRVGQAASVYQGLSTDERSLLDSSFNLIFEISPAKPQIYISEEIPIVLTDNYGGKPNEQWRNPKEILADPRGVSAGEVRAVYIPDDVWDTPTARVALAKLGDMGIPADSVHTTSDFTERTTTLDHCMMRYGNFSSVDLANAIRSRKMTHIFDGNSALA